MMFTGLPGHYPSTYYIGDRDTDYDVVASIAEARKMAAEDIWYVYTWYMPGIYLSDIHAE